jgi:hypothetical protein
MKIKNFFLAALLAATAIGGQAAAEALTQPLSKGQTIYLPLYSHVYFGDRQREFNLTATAYVRNTDPKRAITLSAADYYSYEGKMLKAFVDRPMKIAPLASVSFTVKESDTSGGSGAAVMVRWASVEIVNPPVVEAVMIGAASTQGISFVTQGRVINE